MTTPCDVDERAHRLAPQFLKWLQKAKRRSKGRFVVYSAVFSVLEALRDHGWPLKKEHYISEGNQIRMSGAKFRQILERALGQESVSRLKLPTEGGRTTRSAPRVADKLVEWLASNLPHQLTKEEGGIFADCWERVAAKDYEQYMHSISAIRVPKPSPEQPLSEFVRRIIETAKKNRGAVAHHLVGAKLTLRLHPNDEGLASRPYTAADQQADLPGDYWHQNTVFHVTVAPSSKLFEKCRDNLAKGWRVWVITIREKVETARALADDVEKGMAKRLQIVALSDFVGQNLEEIADFSTPRVSQEAEALIKEYNDRIERAENGDPSLKIEFGS